MKDSARTWHKKAMAAQLDSRSKELRRQIISVLEHGKRGHLGASMSLVEILRALYDDTLQYRPHEPEWPDRDRFILSKGHGCIAQYVLLAEKNFFSVDNLLTFCHFNSLLGGHPDSTKIPGVEASTGSLGHGLSVGIGMALTLKSKKKAPRVYVALGDGECNEGSVWEAAMSAGKHALGNLTVLIDYNKYQSYDETCQVQDLEPFAEKWKSFGFNTFDVNGHDTLEISNTLKNSSETQPSAIICHTVKGKGIGFAENNLGWHHKSNISVTDIEALLTALDN